MRRQLMREIQVAVGTSKSAFATPGPYISAEGQCIAVFDHRCCKHQTMCSKRTVEKSMLQSKSYVQQENSGEKHATIEVLKANYNIESLPVLLFFSFTDSLEDLVPAELTLSVGFLCNVWGWSKGSSLCSHGFWMWIPSEKMSGSWMQMCCFTVKENNYIIIYYRHGSAF